MEENHHKRPDCKHCGSPNTYWWDGGIIKLQFTVKEWCAYKCEDCGEITSDEPEIY